MADAESEHVNRCPRCGQSHDLVFAEYRDGRRDDGLARIDRHCAACPGPPIHTHCEDYLVDGWALCPVTHAPILLVVADSDDDSTWFFL